MIYVLRLFIIIKIYFGYNILLGDKSNIKWIEDFVNWKGLWIFLIKKKLIIIYCLDGNFILCMCMEEVLLIMIYYI